MKNILGVIGCCLVLSTAGCVSVPYPGSGDQWGLSGRGVYHPVDKGETVWRISRVYGVPLESIVRVNHIVDPTQIKAGQRLFIPGATQVIEIEGALDDIKDEDFVWPVDGNLVARFGSDKSYYDQGIRIKALADAPIKAVRSGKVVFADKLPGYGQTIIVDHQNGLSSVYCGDIRFEKDVYADVRADDVLAHVKGARDTTVYFELRRNGVPDNPLFYFEGRHF